MQNGRQVIYSLDTNSRSPINNHYPKVPILQHCAYFGKRQLGKRQANIDDGCSTRRR